MKHKNLDGIVTLSKAYTLKGSLSQQFLFNVYNREKFFLSAAQYLLLKEDCNGTKNLSEILEEYNSNSHKKIIKFLEKLQQIGAISFINNKRVRYFPGLPKNPHLQSIHFEITSQCNMKCKHCIRRDYYGRQQI